MLAKGNNFANFFPNWVTRKKYHAVKRLISMDRVWFLSLASSKWSKSFFRLIKMNFLTQFSFNVWKREGHWVVLFPSNITACILRSRLFHISVMKCQSVLLNRPRISFTAVWLRLWCARLAPGRHFVAPVQKANNFIVCVSFSCLAHFKLAYAPCGHNIGRTLIPTEWSKTILYPFRHTNRGWMTMEWKERYLILTLVMTSSSSLD